MPNFAIFVFFYILRKNGAPLFNFAYHIDITAGILLHDSQNLVIVAEIFRYRGADVLNVCVASRRRTTYSMLGRVTRQ